MNSTIIRKKYIDFFVARGHIEVPSAPLVPENDPSTLFNSSGMQPLVPYLLGESHPAGKRLVNSQKALRLQDIDEVGDNRHTTFFEMLGNWSLGDYFKKEQLSWAFLYLTQEIGLDPQNLYVTVFEGNESVHKDKESIDIWKDIFFGVGIQAKEGERIFAYPAKKNWWSRSGEPENMPPGEPGGPDSEIFFDFGEALRLHERSLWKDEKCHPNCDCGRFMEIGNSVFMQYQKTPKGTLEELPQKNVDFGGGLERITAASINNPDVFFIDVFTPSLSYLESISSKHYGSELHITTSMRIIADHIRGAVMLLSDGVMPSNKQQGYVLRRLIRRSLMYGRQLGLNQHWEYIGKMVEPYAELYKDAYPQVKEQSKHISDVLEEEAKRFGKTLEKGMNEIRKVEHLTGKVAFSLYETYGFPWEMTAEIATQKGQHIDKEEFESEFKKHQELSRTAASGMFKGGLADQSVQTTKLHTAHHLLLAVLQQVVDPSIRQRGSNITSERLRMDINLNRKLTDEEIQKVEELINIHIQKRLDIVRIDMPKEEAERIGAQMEFNHKYPDTVSVYYIGLDKNVPLQEVTHDHYISAEFCGGPHVLNTGDLGRFAITKQESSGSGIRRIYATLS